MQQLFISMKKIASFELIWVELSYEVCEEGKLL